MKVKSEQELINIGQDFARKIKTPLVIELVGDVGVGKTTFVRGLAKGLGIKDTVTSPSFTISKVYALPNEKRLVHYDFYRLSEPGLLVDDLMENINDDNTIIIVEWGESIEGVLPKNRVKIRIDYAEDGREIVL